MSAQPLPPLPLKCYELLALLADAKEPVQQENIPKPLDGDPLTVCRGRGYVESYNANTEQRFPGACLRTRGKGGRRYYDYETRRWLGTVFLNHIRLSKEGRTCLTEYRLRYEAQSARPEQGQGEKRRGARTKKETKQRADFAKSLVDQGLTWLEIFERYTKTPKGKADKTANVDTMRLAFQRQSPK
jgi:hypothetical protein